MYVSPLYLNKLLLSNSASSFCLIKLHKLYVLSLFNPVKVIRIIGLDLSLIILLVNLKLFLSLEIYVYLICLFGVISKIVNKYCKNSPASCVSVPWNRWDTLKFLNVDV